MPISYQLPKQDYDFVVVVYKMGVRVWKALMFYYYYYGQARTRL